MRPTLLDINSEIRRHTGDSEVTGGQQFTNAFNRPGILTAWNVLHATLVERDLSQIQRKAYYNLPAYTGYAALSTLGIEDMGQPVLVHARPITGTTTLQSIAPGGTGDAPYVDITLATPHLLTAPTEVVIYRALGDPGITDLNDIWMGIPQSASVIRLMGCPVTVNYTVSSAKVSWSTIPFPREPVPQKDSIDPTEFASPPSNLAGWEWSRGAFKFIPSNRDLQLRLTYLIFPRIPDNWPDATALPIDNCLDFLSHYAAAGLLHGLSGDSDLVQSLYVKASGSATGMFDEPGGFLKSILKTSTKQDQMEEPIIVPRFRAKRNTGLSNWY